MVWLHSGDYIVRRNIHAARLELRSFRGEVFIWNKLDIVSYGEESRHAPSQGSGGEVIRKLEAIKLG